MSFISANKLKITNKLNKNSGNRNKKRGFKVYSNSMNLFFVSTNSLIHDNICLFFAFSLKTRLKLNKMPIDNTL